VKSLLAFLLAGVALALQTQVMNAPAPSGSAHAASAPVVRSAAGAGPEDVEPAMAALRADLGDANNGAASSLTVQSARNASLQAGLASAGVVSVYRGEPGSPRRAPQASNGWREVSWDDVPDADAMPNPLPPDFYNTTSPGGIVLATPGTGFAVSANDGVTAVHFGDLTPSYADLFTVFSPQRLLTPLGSTVTDVRFFVPGTTTAASVSGFGAVFSNVRLAGAASIEYFAADGASLGVWYAEPDGGNGLSFLGVSWGDGTRIARVRITSGTQPLGAGVVDSGKTNVVALDDFIYSEPRAAQ
jgi:hypothetical protein